MIHDVVLSTTGKMIIWDGTNTEEVKEFLGIANVYEVPVLQRLRIRIQGTNWKDVRKGYAIVVGESGLRYILTPSERQNATEHDWRVLK